MNRDPEFWILLSCLLVLALRYDIQFRRIPNWLVLAGLTAGILSNAFSFPWATVEPTTAAVVVFEGDDKLYQSLLGALCGLAVLLPLYLRSAMGAGDAKLMAAIGAFLGPTQILGAALLTFIAGGLLSVLVALASGSLPRVLNNLRLMGMVSFGGRSSGLALRDIDTTGRLPYAVAICTGTLLQLYLASHAAWTFA